MVKLTNKEVLFLLNMIESESIRLDSIKGEVKNNKTIKEPLEMITELKKKISSSNAYCI